MSKSNPRQAEELIEKLRRDVLKIAEHFNDPDYQRQNFPTMHARSNINGIFGKFEKALEAYAAEKVAEAYGKGPFKEQRYHKFNAADFCKNCGAAGDCAEWSCEQYKFNLGDRNG